LSELSPGVFRGVTWWRRTLEDMELSLWEGRCCRELGRCCMSSQGNWDARKKQRVITGKYQGVGSWWVTGKVSIPVGRGFLARDCTRKATIAQGHTAMRNQYLTKSTSPRSVHRITWGGIKVFVKEYYGINWRKRWVTHTGFLNGRWEEEE